MFHIKLTGISTPFGSLSWENKDSDSTVAKQLITFLQDRRVITSRLGHAGLLVQENRPYAIKSIKKSEHV